MSRIVVTGSTGQLGGRVSRRLAAARVPQVLLVRGKARAPALPLPRSPGPGSPTRRRDHWATERHSRASGPGFTFLRHNLYADFLPA